MKSPTVRFAPSPTGSLHLGNARTALFNWLVARRSGGRMILRIEDTDVERGEAGSEEGILADLRWMGLDWDEGPDVGGPRGPYRQSERATLHGDAAGRLVEAGRAYRCFCDAETLEQARRRQRAEGLTPRYAGGCDRLDPEDADSRAGEPHAIRFRIRASGEALGDIVEFDDRLRGVVRFPLAELGDPVIVRRDGRPTYNFAVVVDDAAMGVDLVLRGDDHLSNTPRQVKIFEALKAPLPEFAHLPMVRGPDGERLSKRHGATAVAEFRRRGYPAAGLVNALALMGWSPGGDRTIVGLDELLAEFDLGRVSRSAAVFDPAKLEWICGQHLQAMPVESLARGVGERLVEAGRLPDTLPAGAAGWLADAAELARSYLHRMEQVDERLAGVFYAGGRPAEPEALAVLGSDAGRAVLRALAAEPPPELDDAGAAQAWVARIKAASGAKGKGLFQPLRAVLTGSVHGPELNPLLALIDRGSRLWPERIPTLAARVGRVAP